VELNKKVLTKESFETLESIMLNPNFNNFYLAGGTALALQLGHRKSIDLDFFSQKEFNTGLTNDLKTKNITDYKVVSLSDNSIELIINNTKIFFFYFAFPLFKKLKTISNIRLADPMNIGLMKLLALQGRSSRKDIIDLYLIDQQVIPLEKLLNIFEEHFPKESFNSYSSLKGLIDEKFLESEPMPMMLQQIDWQTALSRVEEKVVKHIQGIIKKE